MVKRLLTATSIFFLVLSACKSESDPEPQKQIAIQPASVTLNEGGTQQFSVTGGEPCDWTLESGVGTVSSTGLYTAPSSVASTGNAVVKATLKSDNSVTATATVTINKVVSFASQIKPILNNNCTSCHSGSAPSGNYNLTTYTGVKAGNRVVAGDPNNSLMYQRITNASNPMPQGGLMPEANRELIRTWIQQGALNN